MKKVLISKAKATLSKLVEQACAGEVVIIARGKTPLVRLVPVVQPTPQRKFGALEGTVTVDDSFFEPLPDAELDAWE